MKDFLQKAPLYAFIYLSLIIAFMVTQFSDTWETYFPYFKEEGEAIRDTTMALFNSVETVYDDSRRSEHTVYMGGVPLEEIEIPDTPEENNNEVLAVVEPPEPTIPWGEPLEDIIEASKPDPYYKEAAVSQSYFNDAVFLGDSRTVGLSLYSGWDNCDYLCDVGMTIYDCLDRDIEYKNTSHTTAREILTTNKYGKVYIMLGINECGSKLDTWIAKYSEVIDQIHSWQPDAIIVVQSVMCVGAQKSASHPSINNPNIHKRNARLAELANDFYIYYLDINPAVCDADGNLTEGYSFDQVHLYAKYYKLWCEYLLQHGFVFSGVLRR